VSRIWHIIVREYLENVRTKAFLIGLFLTPLWFGIVFFVPQLLQEAKGKVEHVVIVDATGVLAGPLTEALGGESPEEGTPRFEVEVQEAEGAWDGSPSPVDRLRQQAAEGELFAIVLGQEVLEKKSPPRDGPLVGILGANSVGARTTGHVLGAAVDAVINQRIMKERNIRPADAALLAKSALPYRGFTREGTEGGAFQAITPMIFMLLLFMGIVGISQMLVSSTIEEKGNRVYELLLSSVKPAHLMAGKIIAICAVGFTLMALWSGGGIAAAAAQGIGGLVTGGQIGLFVVYYVLGFMLIASLMVAVGSACNTLKEAQNLMAPLSLLLAMPLILSIAVLKDPNGTFATAASFFPPFTPFMMMARVAAVPGPPTWQIVASILLLLASTWLAVRLAGRVFRVGILLYGQPPRLSEIWRWMRTRD
jgi:ABC-type Na+ efflux pump permease subunit